MKKALYIVIAVVLVIVIIVVMKKMKGGKLATDEQFKKILSVGGATGDFANLTVEDLRKEVPTLTVAQADKMIKYMEADDKEKLAELYKEIGLA